MSLSSSAVARISAPLSSGEGVYGLVLTSGLIASASSAQASSFRVLVFLIVTVLVFWLAHVYSDAVAEHGKEDSDGHPISLGTAAARSLRAGRGMLIAAVFPAVALLLGALGVLQDNTANWLALWVCVGVLAWLGYRSYKLRGASLRIRLLGALATASFGLIIIVAKAIVTH